MRRVVNQLDIINAHGADDDNRPVVIGSIGRRATGESGIRGLHDNGHVRFDAGLQCTPHFNQVTWTHNSQRFTAAKAPPPSESLHLGTVSQGIAGTHRLGELGEQCLRVKCEGLGCLVHESSLNWSDQYNRSPLENAAL